MEKIYESTKRKILKNENCTITELSQGILDTEKYEDGAMILKVCGANCFQYLKYQSIKLATYAVLLGAYNAKYIVDEIKDDVLENICNTVTDSSKFNLSDFFWVDICNNMSDKLKKKYKLILLKRMTDYGLSVELNREEFKKAVPLYVEKADKRLTVYLDFELDDSDIEIILNNNLLLSDTTNIAESASDGMLIKLIMQQLKVGSAFLNSNKLYVQILNRNLFNKLSTNDKIKMIGKDYRYIYQLNENEISDDEYITAVQAMNWNDELDFIKDIKKGKADRFNNNKLIKALLRDYAPNTFGNYLIEKYVPEIQIDNILGYDIYSLVENNERLFINENYEAYFCTLDQLIERIKYYDDASGGVVINDLEDGGNRLIEELKTKFGGNENE